MAFLLTDCTLIDGTGQEPVSDAALLVEDGRISWVGPQTELPVDARQARQEDASGRTVIPGLIDAHVHVAFNGRESVFDLINKKHDHLVLEAVTSVRNILASGTTSVRDIGGYEYIEMSIRWAIEAGHIPGPRMRTSGQIITMTGGHGHFAALEADGPDELRKAARQQIKAGADTIKMMATGGAATPGQDVQASQFTVEEMTAAVQAAHSMGRTAAAHCHGTNGIKNSLLAGMDSIEHGSYLDEETANLMVERGAALVLTLGAAEVDLNKLPASARADAERMVKALDILDARVRQTAGLGREKGVFFGSGSDAGGNPLSPHDFSMAQELERLVDYGFSPMEAISIATRNNARILRWDSELGTLEPGKLADFVILTENPLDNISNVRKIEAVYKGGEKVSI